MPPETDARAGRREWLGLSLLALPSLLLFMTLTILFLATPHMAGDLEPSSTQMLWILDIYGFLMAGFLVAMGTLGDKIGRRRLLIIGATVFGVVSVVAAYTDDPAMMIFWRAVMGVAAATQMPATLGLIFAMFRDARQRGVAIGVWAASISAGVALGPLLAGILLEAFSWRATFLVAVPVMVIVVIGAPLLLPEHRDPNAGRMDLFSVALTLATLLPFIHGVKELAKELPKDGPVLVPILFIVVGLLSGAWFVLRQLRLDSPLLDVRLFANRTVSGAMGVFILSAIGLGGVYMMFTQYLQLVEDLSPLQTGLSILPAALILIVVATSSPILARRFRPGNIIAAGMAVQVIGYLMLTQVGSTSGLPLLIAGFIVLYPAVAPSMALTTDLVVGSVPPEKAGAASGLSTTASDLGISLGVALIGSVGAATYRSEVDGNLPANAPDAATESLDGAVAAAEHLPAEAGEAILEPARAAFTSGLNLGAGIAAAIAVVAAVFAAAQLRHVPPTGPAPVSAEEPEHANG